MVLLECIASSTILLKSKVQLIDKMEVPSRKLKHVKVVVSQYESVEERERVCKY